MKKKTVLITGSSRGIGRSCALDFARRGWHVYINCRRSLEQLRETEAEILALGGSCTSLPADVSRPEQVRDIFRIIHEENESLDLLVNNAGISMFGLMTDLSDEDWRNVIDTNLSSAFYCCREALPPMVARKRGRIINISSMWGCSGASCEAAYSASKAGLQGLTQALAKELAPSGIPVNCIAFGAIDTDMNARLSPKERAALEEEIPAGRFGTVQEAADLVLLLSEAPVYMTGQIIKMDGGFL